ncbi:LLM class flavin-dependent oxidoreductase [Streptomyces sp. S1D4-11]
MARSGRPARNSAAVLVHLERIGLAVTVSTTYNEPYHTARKVASLDFLSKGRAGWNLVTSASDEEARNFGRDRNVDHATRYERGREFVDVVRGLWDSWDDDALVHDKADGRFADPAKLHTLNPAVPPASSMTATVSASRIGSRSWVTTANPSSASLIRLDRCLRWRHLPGLLRKAPAFGGRFVR